VYFGTYELRFGMWHEYERDSDALVCSRVQDSRLLPQCSWDLCSSGMLHSIFWYLFALPRNSHADTIPCTHIW